MKKLRIFCLSILLVISLEKCSKEGEGLYEFSIESITDKSIPLSWIADDIVYIPLGNEYPIGIYYDVQIFKDIIIIPTYENGILVFDGEGDFKCRIGSKGRGPGEYIGCSSIAVDYENDRIYVLDILNDIEVFTIEGSHIRTISIDALNGDMDEIYGPENFINNVDLFNEKLFLSAYTAFGRLKDNWICIDTMGNFIDGKNNSVAPFKSMISMAGNTYQFENHIFYFDQYNDTVYEISPDLKWEPSYLIDIGVEIPVSPEEELKKLEVIDFLSVKNLFESSRFWVMLCTRQNWKDRQYILIEKESKNTYNMNGRESKGSDNSIKYTGGILNDIDGGVAFQPEFYHVENEQEYMVELLSPNILKNHVGSDEFQNSVAKYAGKKEKLIELANSLDEMDNLILVMVRLK